MTVKIIKSGTSQASKIRSYSFSEHIIDPNVEVDIALPRLEKQMAKPAKPPAVKPKTDVVQAEPDPSQVDLAQVEKTAYENGFVQGERAGMEIAGKKVEAAMRRYGEAILEMGKLKGEIYRQAERDVVKLALEVAKKIVHREVQVDKEIIQTLVKVALSHVAEKSAVTVHLHPVDCNYILEHKSELSQGEGHAREIVLLADKSIERGGCLIQTECGDVDARIEEEFREVERGFFEGLK
jgi:flagellar assembly protein FliH